MPDAPDAEDASTAMFRAVDDIGVRVPLGITQPVDAELKALIERLAGVTRGAGIVMAAQEIAADPAGTLKTVLGLLKFLVFARAEQTIDEVTANAPRLGCKSGCAWCCHQSVEVTIPEAILVAGELGDPADPRRQAVLDSAAQFRGRSLIERYRARSPCALLVDNRCSVYGNRPLMCRGMMATDASVCHASHLAALEGKDLPVELFAVAQYFILGDQAGLRGILKDMGLQHDLVDMTQAVAAILRDPGIIDRWLAHEPAFGPEMVVSEPAPETV
jgi:Fe-S-cluster containining protein